MARIIPILGSMRGSLGGDTFSRNKGGDYVRRRVAPVNPQSVRQQTTRTLLGKYAVDWSLVLTAAQRSAWEAYAQDHPVKNSQGQDVLITGLAWYALVNTKLDDAGATTIAWPPVAVAPSGLDTLACDITAITTVVVTFTPALAAGHRLQLWQSLAVSSGSTPNRNQCRLVGYSGAAEASPWTATLRHPIQSAARGVFYAAVMSAEGLTSPYLMDIDDADY